MAARWIFNDLQSVRMLTRDICPAWHVRQPEDAGSLGLRDGFQERTLNVWRQLAFSADLLSIHVPDSWISWFECGFSSHIGDYMSKGWLPNRDPSPLNRGA